MSKIRRSAVGHGSPCVFDYTLPLRDRQAEMFQLSGNQTAARRETQTRAGEGKACLGTTLGKRVPTKRLTNARRRRRKDSNVSYISFSVSGNNAVK